MEYVKIKSIVNVADSVADEDSFIVQQGTVSKQVTRAVALAPYRKSADEDILLAEIDNRLTALERRPDWRGGLRIYSDGTFSRLGDAVGLTARFATGVALTVKSDFMSVGPWKGMRRCILNAMGKITAYEGDDAYETEKAETAGERAQENLDATDYKIVKCAELGLDVETTYPGLKAQRAAWRELVNAAR